MLEVLRARVHPIGRLVLRPFPILVAARRLVVAHGGTGSRALEAVVLPAHARARGLPVEVLLVLLVVRDGDRGGARGQRRVPAV